MPINSSSDENLNLNILSTHNDFLSSLWFFVFSLHTDLNIVSFRTKTQHKMYSSAPNIKMQMVQKKVRRPQNEVWNDSYNLNMWTGRTASINRPWQLTHDFMPFFF